MAESLDETMQSILDPIRRNPTLRQWAELRASLLRQHKAINKGMRAIEKNLQKYDQARLDGDNKGMQRILQVISNQLQTVKNISEQIISDEQKFSVRVDLVRAPGTDLLDQPVAKLLDLPYATVTALNRAGISTIADLLKHDRKSIEAIRGIGPNRLGSLEAALDAMGMQLKP